MTVISYVCLVLTHYFYYTVTYSGMEQFESNVSNTFHITLHQEADSDAVAKQFLPEINERIPSLLSCCCAYGSGEYNDHQFATSLYGTNHIITWGAYPTTSNEVLQFANSEQFRDCDIQGHTFHIAGYGTIRRCLSDYTFSYDTYNELIKKTDYVQMVFSRPLSFREMRFLKSAVYDFFGSDCVFSRNWGIQEGAWRSARNMIFLSAVLVIFSIFSAAMFIKIIMELQSKEIFLFQSSGARRNRLVWAYCSAYIIISACSFLLGFLSYIITKERGLFQFSELGVGVPACIGAVFYFLSVSAAALITVKRSAKHISENYRRVVH